MRAPCTSKSRSGCKLKALESHIHRHMMCWWQRAVLFDRCLTSHQTSTLCWTTKPWTCTFSFGATVHHAQDSNPHISSAAGARHAQKVTSSTARMVPPSLTTATRSTCLASRPRADTQITWWSTRSACSRRISYLRFEFHRQFRRGAESQLLLSLCSTITEGEAGIHRLPARSC